MGQLKRIVVGHDLKTGGETALKSAVVLAGRCNAALAGWCMWWSPTTFIKGSRIRWFPRTISKRLCSKRGGSYRRWLEAGKLCISESI